MSSTPAPRVTIILTIYQRVEFLAGALASVLAQGFRDFEVLVSDDSASPAIAALCATFDDPRIRYRANVPRLGVALNVRAALGEARGEYVAILNDDDEWEPDFLADLVAALDGDARRVLAFCDHSIMNGQGVIDVAASDRNSRLYRRAGLAAGDHHDPAELVLRWNAVPLAMGSMFRRDALDPALVPREVVGAYDLWISAQLAGLGRPFHYVPRRLTRYRSHEGMETGRRAPDKSDNHVFVYRSLLDDARYRRFAPILRRRLADALVESAKDRLYFGQLAAARARFGQSVALRPSPRAAAGWLLTWAPASLRRRLRLEAPLRAQPAIGSA